MINRMTKTRLAGSFVMLSMSLIVGCGSDQLPLSAVSGQVTLNGRPLTNAKVVFLPESGPAASGDLDAEGRFQLTTYTRHDGAVIGQHRVTVVPVVLGVILEPGKLPQPPPPIEGPDIPTRYQQAATSTLRCEVSEDGKPVRLQLVD